MRSSNALIISLLLYHRVIFSEGSFSTEKPFSEKGESILERFFAENKHRLNDQYLRHVTVIGGSGDQIEQTKPLLEVFPYFIGEDLREICRSKEFTPDTFIFYFLSSLEEEYVTRVVEGLGNCKRHRLYFISDVIVASYVDIESLLRIAFEKIHKHPVLVHCEKKSVKFYGYKTTTNCSRNSELLVEWMPGDNWKGLRDFASHFMHGCPVTVGTVHRPPWMNLAEDANGTVKIIGGLEGEIISTIASQLNFTPLVQEFKSFDPKNSGDLPAIVSSCAVGNTSIGIASIRPTENIVEVVDRSYTYAQECIVWCVPRITHWKMNIVASEFSWSTWILIALTFLASLAVERIVRNTSYWNRGNASESGYYNVILDFIGLTLGIPIVYKPLAIGGKILLVIYLCYSTVITTAYKTSLSSILTVENSKLSIVDVQGIIDANLTTGGDVLKLKILEGQKEENKLVPELIKRFLIESNISEALRRVSQDKDFAFMTFMAELTYHKKLLEKAGEPVLFDVLDGCVISQSSSIVLPKSSHFTKQINTILQRLMNTGITNYWSNIERSPQQGDELRSEESSEIRQFRDSLLIFSRAKLFYVFHIYCLASIFSILTFLGEIIVHKFISGKKL